ncbi:hypothetical protein GCM10022254_01000 [Actinomadura meridiana]|uniref:HTH cro/C1-type domain-containing protein n=1 Tax=Actinomadura meridiana TaxID=559626 RepID=A0ABP8BRE0_9ACTN
MSHHVRPLDPDRSTADWVAHELRRLRQQRGATLKELSEITGKHLSLFSKIESGETPLREADADKIDKAWETEGLLGRIIRTGRTRHSSQWEDEIDAIASVAAQARIWSLGWVPALLQTPEYARASFVAAGHTDVEGAVQRRVRLLETLTRKPAPLVRAIIDRSALELPVGTPEEYRAQLDRLIGLAADLTIRVVERRSGPHVGREGSFLIYTTSDGKDYPYTSTVGPGRLIRDPSEVATYRVSFDRISDIALNRADSLTVLKQIRECVDD